MTSSDHPDSNSQAYCWQCQVPVLGDPPACAECKAGRAPAGWPRDPLIGETVGQKFRILKRLGAGGFGVVYLAEHVQFEALRAVKVLHAHLAYDNTIVARFEREARAVYRLTAPSIVRLEEFGEVRPGLSFMAMEYAEGESLEAVLERDGRLDLRRALRIARQVALALLDAAEQGVLHRDLKPDNIRVNRHPHRGEEVKVLDFGIAKILDEHTAGLTGASALGTPEFMAPEVWEGSATVDHRVDLFSLGVLIFRMLTGTVPWPAVTGEPLTVFAQMQAEPAPRLDAIVHTALPPVLVELVDSLLARDPAARPADAGVVIAVIDELGILSTGAMDVLSADHLVAIDEAQPAPPGTMATLPTLADGRREGAQKARGAYRVSQASSGPVAAVDSSNSQPNPLMGAASFGPPPAQQPGTPFVTVAVVIALLAGAVVGGWLVFRDPSPIDVPQPFVTEPDAVVPAAPIELAPREAMIAVVSGPVELGQSEADFEAQQDELGAHIDRRFEARRTVELSPYYIDRYEVSVADYHGFQRRLAQDPELLSEYARRCPGGNVRSGFGGNPQEPVRGVTYHEAELYCQSTGKRLPTSDEWETAARGNHGGRYPWPGDLSTAGAYNGGSASQPIEGQATSVVDGFAEIAPVTALGAGASELGVEGLGGNVAEWVSSPGQDPATATFRGGSFMSHPVFLQVFAYQRVPDACQQLPSVGFRCAADPVD